ncbi:MULTISPECIES: LuxR C-terminal-related transcriptional regulator [Providencia]|uniref:LuxR C-terminal-related transcriptional regulator n=6 Tax=Providencia TaxID=586 RepID=A0AA42FSN4_9GAMM|nr:MULTISPECIES: LuxR C-terminal-related transcriptional regulator [Providencia]APC11509.1 Response regulator UvrY [Providencia rettgeri]AVL74860.1 DNA-binding response regulator [Providencia rettgeri]EIU7558568.1 response regulator [Providencia rettgeri]EIU9516943.1 response regulator [Providencia rettgeri]EJD6041747.1 response regulator [Providencia rettgeri]
MINIIIIDDNNITIRGFEAIFSRHSRYKTIASFPSIQQVITWNRNQKANIILISSVKLQYDSLKTLQTLRRTQPDVGIIIYNVRNNYAFFLKALDIGIFGLLSVHVTEEDLIEAIRVVNVKRRIISPDIAQDLALHRLDYSHQKDLCDLLSGRELEIMLMITKGMPIKVVAEALSLSPKTVNTYRYRMFSKLNIGSDVELTHIAIGYGLITAKQGLSEWQNSSSQKRS